MKKTNILFALVAICFIAYTSQSCQKEAELVADDSTFANFSSWSLDKTNTGPGAFLATAHNGADSSVVRDIYFKDGQNPENGMYPVGTVIVKHSHATGFDEYTAMVKRGNGFNPSHNGWEWFMLNSDGTIRVDAATGNPMRGADLMGGMCNGCHSNASTDYSFAK